VRSAQIALPKGSPLRESLNLALLEILESDSSASHSRARRLRRLDGSRDAAGPTPSSSCTKTSTTISNFTASAAT
jgi:hypothetical protein